MDKLDHLKVRRYHCDSAGATHGYDCLHANCNTTHNTTI